MGNDAMNPRKRGSYGTGLLQRIPGRSSFFQLLLIGWALQSSCAVVALGQMNCGQIQGRVTDPSGVVIANAVVTAQQSDTQALFRAVTNSSGLYLLPLLPVGNYSLTVTAPNFRESIFPNLILHAGDHLTQDFVLQIGVKMLTIIVTGTPGLLQFQSAAIKNTIAQKQVINLPLNGRQITQLMELTPGIATNPGGTRGAALSQAGPTFGILGQRAGHNLYLVDGVSVTDEYFNNIVLSPSLDDIREFSIDATAYDAEFGGKSGAVINVVTKSGSNRLHGSLFEFVRNEAFDARNYFNSPTRPIPPFKQNQFGGSFGGPLMKKKTFFFLDYEGLRTRRTETHLFTVPTLGERSGNFQGVATIYDPSTTNAVSSQRQAFPSDTIPQIDPVAKAILKLIPPPTPGLTGAPNNLLATDMSTISDNQYTARIDQRFSSNDRLFARGTSYVALEFDPFGSSALDQSMIPGFGQFLHTHTDNFAVDWTHVFSLGWYNDIRFGWLRVTGGQTSPNAGISLAGSTGLEGVTSIPQDTGYPAISPTSFSPMGDPSLFVSESDSDEELFDDVIWQHGTHNVKFGVYYFHLNFNPVSPNNVRGAFQFTPAWSSSSADSAVATGGNALADFMLGYPALAQVGQGTGALHARTNWLQIYIQDSWQMLPSLSMDLGLRYEYNQPLYSTSNDLSVIDTRVPGGQFVIASDSRGKISPEAAPLLSQIPIPYVTSSEIGWDRSLLQSCPVRLAPRLGVAWRLPDRKTVLRAGIGIYTNQAAYSVNANAALNLPFFFNKTIAASETNAAPAYTTENILTAPNTGAISASNVSHDYKVEYNEVWNLAVEHSFTSSTAFELQYAGSRTVHADNESLFNLYHPGGSISPGVARPIPQMSGFTGVVWNGWETYNALMLQLVQHTWHGLSLDANYTWSKALDVASNPGPTNSETNLPQNPADLAAEKGLSSFNVPQRFVASFIYQIPAMQNAGGWKHHVLSGWQAGGIWIAQSGSPFTVNLPYDNAHNGTPVLNQRPNVICNPNNGPKTVDEWFNTACFRVPAPNAYGDAGRNDVSGPGLSDLDISLQRNFPIRKKKALTFRVDTFDLINHPNFDIPNRMFTATASNFGTISSAHSSRELQLSLRLIF